MKAPPPTSTVLAGQDTVTAAPELADVGPATSAFSTLMVGFVASVLHTAKAYVVLVPPPPPFRPTAVHELGFVPEVTGVPVELLGKLPMILRLPAVPGVVLAPPLSRRSFAGQVAVALAIVSPVFGPDVLGASTNVAEGPDEMHMPKPHVWALLGPRHRLRPLPSSRWDSCRRWRTV